MVKTLSKILMLASFAMVLFISGCSKDDKESATGKITGSFTYDSNSYTLTQGAIVNYGPYEDLKSNLYNLDLYLMSDGIKLDNYSGEGNYLYFEMFSSSETALLSGTYNYGAPTTFTFDYATMYLNYNLLTDIGSSVVELTSGTVTISQSGSNYTVSIDCEDIDGKKLQGHAKEVLSIMPRHHGLKI